MIFDNLVLSNIYISFINFGGLNNIYMDYRKINISLEKFFFLHNNNVAEVIGSAKQQQTIRALVAYLQVV